MKMCWGKEGERASITVRPELPPGQDDLDHVTLFLHSSAQSSHHIAQAAHFADWGHLHRHVHHMQPRGINLHSTEHNQLTSMIQDQFFP